MNTELKASLSVIFALVGIIESAIAKSDFTTVILPKIYSLAVLLPPATQNIADFSNEITALSGAAQEADLLAFIISQFDNVTTDTHAKSILAAAVKLTGDLIPDSIALATAIKG